MKSFIFLQHLIVFLVGVLILLSILFMIKYACENRIEMNHVTSGDMATSRIDERASLSRKEKIQRGKLSSSEI